MSQTISPWSEPMGGGGDKASRISASFSCPPGSYINEIGTYTTGSNAQGQPFIGGLEPKCSSGTPTIQNSLGHAKDIPRQGTSGKTIYSSPKGVKSIQWNGGTTLEGVAFTGVDDKSSGLIGANTGSQSGKTECPPGQVLVGLKGIDSTYYNTYGILAQLQAQCDFPVDCSKPENVLSNPECNTWAMTNPDKARQSANEYCARMNNIITKECEAWFKKTYDTNGTLSDTLVGNYCKNNPTDIDICGCYNWESIPEYKIIQDQLKRQGGQTLLPQCNIKECVANDKAYKPYNMRNYDCPDQQVCLQGITLGSAQVASFEGVSINCNQQATTNNGGNITTPTAPTEESQEQASSSQDSMAKSLSKNTILLIIVAIILMIIMSSSVILLIM